MVVGMGIVSFLDSASNWLSDITNHSEMVEKAVITTVVIIVVYRMLIKDD